MSSQENNIIFQKTSFLSGTNSSYIEKLYAKYVENPSSIPDSWRQFFDGLGDQKNNIIENQGPSWAPSNIKHISNGDLDIYEKYLPKNLNGNSIKEKIIEKNKTLSNDERLDVERSTIDSIRAIMMIRAYRIRGHLIADLDPLQLQEKNYHPELNPETYGFKKEDRNRKIFLDKVLGLEYATVNEILDKNYLTKIPFSYFGNYGLTPDFFNKHIQSSIKDLGPRFNEDLNFQLPIAKIFNDIARDNLFFKRFLNIVDKWVLEKGYRKLINNIHLDKIESDQNELKQKVTDWIKNQKNSVTEKIELNWIFDSINKINEEDKIVNSREYKFRRKSDYIILKNKNVKTILIPYLIGALDVYKLGLKNNENGDLEVIINEHRSGGLFFIPMGWTEEISYEKYKRIE